MSTISEPAVSVKIGVYRHHEGGTYLALGTFTHKRSRERMVAYVDLKDQAKVWTCPVEEWFEVLPSGKTRFTLACDVKNVSWSTKGWSI